MSWELSQIWAIALNQARVTCYRASQAMTFPLLACKSGWLDSYEEDRHETEAAREG